MSNYNCELCESIFGLKSNLTKHVKKFHSCSDEICPVTTRLVKKSIKKTEVVDDNINNSLLIEIERLKMENIQNLEMQKLRLENDHIKYVNELVMSHNTELTNMLKMLMSQKNSTPIVCETPVVQTQIIETPVVKTENIEIFIEDEANEDDDVDDDVDEDEDEDETNEAEIKIIEPTIFKKPK